MNAKNNDLTVEITGHCENPEGDGVTYINAVDAHARGCMVLSLIPEDGEKHNTALHVHIMGEFRAMDLVRILKNLRRCFGKSLFTRAFFMALNDDEEDGNGDVE